MADLGALVRSACGIAVVGISVFFIAFRPALLPRDRRYVAAPDEVLEAVLPGLGRWLHEVICVMGGWMIAPQPT